MGKLREHGDLLNRLLDAAPSTWSADDLTAVLTHRYAPTIIPPCHICGAELSMQSVGGGRPTAWACDGREWDADGAWKWKEGRTPADDHYNESRFEDTRRGGDEFVMEAVRRLGVVEKLARLLAERQWSPNDIGDDECDACGERKADRGHAPGCEVAGVLGECGLGVR